MSPKLCYITVLSIFVNDFLVATDEIDYAKIKRSAAAVLYDMFGVPKYDWPKIETDATTNLETAPPITVALEVERSPSVENKFKPPSGRLKYTFIASSPVETTTVEHEENVATPWHFDVTENAVQPTTRKTSNVKTKLNKATGSVFFFSAPLPSSDDDNTFHEQSDRPLENDIISTTRSVGNEETTKFQPSQATTARVTNRLVDLEWRLRHFGFDDDEPAATSTFSTSRTTASPQASLLNNLAPPPNAFSIVNNDNGFGTLERKFFSSNGVATNNAEQNSFPQSAFSGQRQPEFYSAPSIRPPPFYNGATGNVFELTSPPSYISGRAAPPVKETFQGSQTSGSWDLLRNRWNGPNELQVGQSGSNVGANEGSSNANNVAGGYSENQQTSCYCPCPGRIVIQAPAYNIPARSNYGGNPNRNNFQGHQPFHSSDNSGYFFFGPPLKGR